MGGTSDACVSAADCGPATACATPSCVGGVCVTSYAPLGTPSGPQTIGDCQKVVCDGHGEASAVTDDNDVPDDGNPCTVDTCSGGAPQHQPAGAGTSCGPGLVCIGTACVGGCVIGGTSYTTGTVDPANACQACDPATSTSAWSSRPDTTACDDGGACTSGDHCANGACVGTPYTCAPTSCQTGAACDGHGGCTFTSKPQGTPCPDSTPSSNYPGVCMNGACLAGCYVSGVFYMAGYQLDNLCQLCDPTKSTSTLQPTDGVSCDDGDPCTWTDQCHGGVCSGAPYPCPPGQTCHNGTCQ
jgi:hypothetical protein